MVQPMQIQRATEMLREAARPKRIILFGSHARGQASEDSDLDLLVVEAHVSDRAAEMVRLNRVLSPLRIPVDLLVVSDAAFQYWSEVPDNVYYDAWRNGKILYEAA